MHPNLPRHCIPSASCHDVRHVSYRHHLPSKGLMQGEGFDVQSILCELWRTLIGAWGAMPAAEEAVCGQWSQLALLNCCESTQELLENSSWKHSGACCGFGVEWSVRAAYHSQCRYVRCFRFLDGDDICLE
eukprot:Gb_06600 [translate_table: standard]